MIGKPVYARKDGKSLGNCIGGGISSKGEMMFLVEGTESFLVGTSKTLSTVRPVDRGFKEETLVIERAEGKHTVNRVSWGK